MAPFTNSSRINRFISQSLGSLLVCGTLISCASPLQAAVQLGGLMGKDVTDPANLINSRDSLSLGTWTSSASGHESMFADVESPANLFNNAVGGGTAKWYDPGAPTADNPAFVEVTFPEAFVMTHFTLTSGNDSITSRTPTDWGVYGSNDGGQTWNLIYSENNSAGFVGTVNTTKLYSSFTNDTLSSSVLNSAQQAHVTAALGDRTISTADFTNTTAYSSYRLEITKNRGNDGTQLGEWEIYGNTVTDAASKTSPLQTSGNSAAALLANSSKYTLDAQNAASITADENGNVSAWNSVGKESYVFTQSNAAYRPTMTTVDINGTAFNALNFEDASGNTRSDHLICGSLADVRTVLILAKNEGSKGLMGIWGSQGDFGLRLNGNGRWQDNTCGANGGDFMQTGTVLYNGGGASGVVLKDNVYLTQATRGSCASLGSNVVGDYFTSTSYGNRGYDGNIMEVMTFDHVLCAAENRLVNTYFQTKYGMEIAGSVDVIPTDNEAFSKDLLAVMNQPRSADSGTRYVIGESGAGGIAIGGRDAQAAVSSNPFDIFSPYGPASGAEIYAVTNIGAGETFGTTEITTVDGMEMQVWDKQLYLTNASAEDTVEWNVTMAFNGIDAGLEEAEKDISQWTLLYRETENDAFAVIDGLSAIEFEDGYLDFTFSSSLLNTGFYALGTDTRYLAPEPGTMVLLLLGAAGLFILRRRQKTAAV